MQTGYILCFFIFPIFLEGCCVGNRQKKETGHQWNATYKHYRAVEGEIFMLPCIESRKQHMQVVWSRTGQGREATEGPSIVCGREFIADAKHSGEYTYSGSKSFLYMQVVERLSLGCFQPEESSQTLNASQGGEVSCPSLNCSDNTDVIWYKGNKPMSEQRRDLCQETGKLHICQVDRYDTGIYFCDRRIIEQGITWTFRRAVNVTVVPYPEEDPPRIIDPEVNITEEVELGQGHTLMCRAHFPFEMDFSPKVRWYVNYYGNVENMTLLHMERPQRERPSFTTFEVIQRAIIKKVTPQHLKHTYTCIASNTFGDDRVTIKLKERIKVKWPSLVGYPVASLLLVAGLGIVLHVKWLEIQLIYRSHFQHRKHDGDKKEFDVFLSYVGSPPSAEVEGLLTLSSQRGPGIDKKACTSSMDLLDTEEGKATQRPLEVRLAQVLEEQWGYRLCLLERDVLPGGAYTNDVVNAIQRSQMLICLLSADYLSNSNAVFVLESGVQALLQNSPIKLLIIWTSKASSSLIQPDPPLPTLVQRALKVLPSLMWTSGKPATSTSKLWRSLRRAMPNQRVKMVSLMQNQ